MADNLVIVESPAKAKTIGKFLGSKYKVVASNGHVRDLPKSQLGVDEANDFEPKYITLRGRGEVLDRIRREAKGAKHVLLATDPDMEGEAISWLDALIITPICPHTLTSRPIVAPAGVKASFSMKTEGCLSVDGIYTSNISTVDTITVSEVGAEVGFVRFGRQNIYELIRQRLS